MNSLLVEALDHITDKPWDDKTLLHARISAELGLPVQYSDFIQEMWEDVDEKYKTPALTRVIE